jgi:hypothetical protein
MIFLLEESRGSRRSPADHRSESRLSIPRRGALQRSSSLLPQPSSILKRTVEIVENYSANGKCLIVRLCHLWGAPQSVQRAVLHPRKRGRERGRRLVAVTPL